MLAPFPSWKTPDSMKTPSSMQLISLQLTAEGPDTSSGLSLDSLVAGPQKVPSSVPFLLRPLTVSSPVAVLSALDGWYMKRRE